jgi:hypothetical protein
MNMTYGPNNQSQQYAATNSLNLDLRLYLNESAPGVGQVPWDITREGLDPTPAPALVDNSQFPGKTTTQVVTYYNTQYPNGVVVYALIFVFSGNGSANMTINSNYPLTFIPRSAIPIGGLEGWVLDNIWLIGGVLVAALVGLIIVMVEVRRKYVRYIEEQKEKTVKEKLGPGAGESIPGVTILSKQVSDMNDDKEKDKGKKKSKK